MSLDNDTAWATRAHAVSLLVSTAAAQAQAAERWRHATAGPSTLRLSGSEPSAGTLSSARRYALSSTLSPVPLWKAQAALRPLEPRGEPLWKRPVFLDLTSALRVGSQALMTPAHHHSLWGSPRPG